MRCIASSPFAVFLTCVAAGQSALAQEAPEIVVTGRALGAPASDKTYDVTVIDAAVLRGTASARIEDVLKDGGGMQQFRRSDSRSAHPTSQGAGLRGLGGNASSRALVLMDGVPLADPFGGWIDWPSLDPRRLGQVRVTRGGGAGAFGAGALAGVIELDSAARDELPTIDAGIAYGERDSVIADAAGTVDVLGGFATLSGRIDSGDGFTPIREDQRGRVDRPAPYDQWTMRGRYVAPLGDDIELQTAISAFSDDRDRGTNFTGNKSEGQDVSVRVIGRGDWGWEALAFAQRREFRSQFASSPPAGPRSRKAWISSRRPRTATAPSSKYARPSARIPNCASAWIIAKPMAIRTSALRSSAAWRRVCVKRAEPTTPLGSSRNTPRRRSNA